MSRGTIVAARRRLGVLAVLIATALTSVAPPALAQQVSTGDRQRILGEATHERVTVRLSGGAVARGDLVRFPERDGTLQLQPRLAGGTITGTQAFGPMQRGEFSRRAIAGTNGGYFLPGSRPFGAPNGLHVQGGRLSSTEAVTTTGRRIEGRAALGVRADGRILADRIAVQLELDVPGLLPLLGSDAELTVDELNRRPVSGRDTGTLVYDDRFGTAVPVAAGRTVLSVSGWSLTSSGRTVGRIEQVRRPSSSTGVGVPRGTHLVVADSGGPLGEVRAGQQLGITPTIAPANNRTSSWQGLRAGAAGGQLLLSGGGLRPNTEHTSFSAFSDAHANTRRARTAVGRNGSGQALLLTLDERNSAGVTVAELARVMQALGATDAVNMDGGGSTQMAVAGRVVNRPSDPGRGHSTGLFLYAAAPPPPRDLAGACRDAPRSSFRDVQGTTHAAAIDCLRHWGLAQGRNATTYAPFDDVTRGQMATFLANLIDDVATRGSGRPLPARADHPFADARGTTHETAIARLHRAGIVNGTSATRYRPSASISRAQTAALVRRTLDFIDPANALPAGRDHFLDDNGSVHEPDIDRLARQGIIAGTGGLSFAPSRPVSRGAMAALVMRAADLLVERGTVRAPR